MLIFVSGYGKSQILNSSGAPFSGPVLPVLRQLELADLFGDLTGVSSLSAAEITTAGPSGAAGVLFSVGAPGIDPDPARFLPERQAWMQVSSAVWIGTETDPLSGDPSPGPERLERETCIVTSAENVVLADGNIWEVPVIRQPADEAGLLPVDSQRSNLPSVYYRNVDGQWIMDVVPRYQDLWRQSRVMLDALIAGQGLLYSDMMTYAAAVLGLRYRFNLLIHSRWPDRYLTTDNVLNVVRASIGWHIITEHLDAKKKIQPDLELSTIDCGD